MGFMTAYKRLDNLCRDINGKGVTGYIEDMERSPIAYRYISGWTQDYQQLKHYRYIRNQIAHDNYADEDNTCSEADTLWVETFHQRIIDRNDPLALYYQHTRSSAQGRTAATSSTKGVPYEIPNTPIQSKKPSGCAMSLLFGLTIIALLILIF